MKDASVLLNNYYDDKRCEPYKEMMHREISHLQPYDDYEQSLEILRGGI